MTDIVWAASSAALILIVILVRAIFGKKMSAGFRYALWALVLVRLLIPGTIFSSPVSVKSAISESPVVKDLEAVEGITSVSRTDTGVVTGVRRSSLPSRPTVPTATKSPVGGEETVSSVVIEREATPERFERIKKTIEIRDILNIVWYAGMGLTAAYVVFVNVRFYIKLRKRRELIKADAPCRVYSVPELDSSCLFMNAIYVSNETAEDESTLRFVLAHELAHRRHFDAVFAILRSAALILHWYDPLVWVAAVLSRRDGELFADAGAVSSLGESERENYGRTLISLAAGKSARANIACAATAMTNGKRELKARITHVAKRRRTGILIAVVVVLTALLAVGCSFLGGKKPASTPDPTAAPTVAPPDHHMTPDPTEPAPTPEVMVFESSALEACVREQLKLTDEEPITPSMIRGIKYLEIHGEGIADLSQLKLFTGLRSFMVYDAPNADFSGLGELPLLEELIVSDCGLTDISFITDLPRLRTLGLPGNYIEDISPVSALTGLKVLDISNNRVRDLSPLLSINGLGSVSLSWNPITSDQANELRSHVEETGDEDYGASVSFYTAEEETARWTIDLDGDGRDEYFCAQLSLLMNDFISFAWVEDADGRLIGREFYLGTGHVAFNTFAVVNSAEFGVCLMRIPPEFKGQYYGYELFRIENGELKKVYGEVLFNFDEDEPTYPDQAAVVSYNERVNALLGSGYVLITTDRWGVMEKELYIMESGKTLGSGSNDRIAVICTVGIGGSGINELRGALENAGVTFVDGRLNYRMNAEPSRE